MMKNGIDQEFKQLFLEKSPEVLLHQWIQTLDDTNKNYESLVKRGLMTQKALQNMLLPIRLRPGLLKELHNKLCKLQEILKRNPKTPNSNPTHEEILREIEPLIYTYYQALKEKSSQELLNLIAHDPHGHKYLDTLFQAKFPFPVIGMSILQDRDLSSLFPFETLIPNDGKLKALLQTTVFQNAPHNYEEYAQLTIPLGESLRELMTLNPQASHNIFKEALETKNKKSLSRLLTWGIGSPQQITSALRLSELPLKNIYLQSKSFSDDEAKELGEALRSRTDLRTLSLKTDRRQESSSPTISRLGLENILQSAKALVQLKSLTIEGYDIGDSGALSLGNLSGLEDLTLSYGNLKNNALFTLAVRMPQLKRLEIPGNHTEASGAGMVLHKFKNLTTFNLSRNKAILRLNSQDCKFFLDELKAHPCLTSLDLSHGGITNSMLDLLSQSLKDHASLKVLNLNYNNITETQPFQGLELLIANPKLQDLNLGKNNIGNKGTIILANALRQNKGGRGLTSGSLTSLDLSYNQISEEGAAALKRILKDNTALKVLNLKGNSLGGDLGISHIIKGLCQNNTLTGLNLSYTPLSEVQVENFFQMLKKNNTLEEVDISGKIEVAPRDKVLSQVKQINHKRQMRGFPPLNVIHILEEQEYRSF